MLLGTGSISTSIDFSPTFFLLISFLCSPFNSFYFNFSFLYFLSFTLSPFVEFPWTIVSVDLPSVLRTALSCDTARFVASVRQSICESTLLLIALNIASHIFGEDGYRYSKPVQKVESSLRSILKNSIANRSSGALRVHRRRCLIFDIFTLSNQS